MQLKSKRGINYGGSKARKGYRMDNPANWTG
jgi:hypothetical protein